MRGIYRFYQGGVLLGESENLLTTEGKRLVLRYLAGQSQSLGGAIAVGVSNVAANVADTRLGFEIDRIPVDLRSADYGNNIVVFKGTIDQDAQYSIYEAGLWSTASNNITGQFNSQILSTFDLDVENWSNVTVDTTAQRTSADAVKVSATSSSTTAASLDVYMDLSGYSANDIFTLAFSKPNNNISTIELMFQDIVSGGTLKKSVTVSSLPTGYNIIQFRKGDFTSTGTISWDSISRMTFNVTAGGTAGYVILDGIRIEDGDVPDKSYILVSHSIPASPIIKSSASPMDIEYALEFNIS
jgi:hypothetical protein